MDHEQIWETGNTDAEVGIEAFSPFLLQANTVSPGDLSSA